jgi:acetyl-CoA acetyltransferase
VDPARWRVRKDPLYNGSFMPVRDVVILSAAHTPIGRYGGSFKDLHPAELGAVAARAAIERAGIKPSDVDEVLVGHRAGIPHRAPAQTINKASSNWVIWSSGD